MFQIHVVDRSNRSSYQTHLDDYFRFRHDIYVGERGWTNLTRTDRREIDAFDTEEATYLLGITSEQNVVAGSRLVPTQQPHLMSEVFPELAQDGIRREKDLYEWTRVFVVPALREPRRPSLAAGIVYCGIVEFCLLRRIRELTIVCEPYWFDRLRTIGWAPKHLGKPLDHKDGVIVGLSVSMSKQALAWTRAFYGVTQSVLWPSASRPGQRANRPSHRAKLSDDKTGTFGR
jgi:acyl-homoserine lactone synthase